MFDHDDDDRKLADEAGRLLALKRYGVLDTGAEQNFDAITAIICEVLDVPICAVSLIDETRQWFKSSVGLEVAETAREVAFCDHTIRGREVMTVEDATADARFADNLLVTGHHDFRSYAGAPLVSPDGYNLGALCAIDHRPRIFDGVQLALLERFSKLVVEQLELRTMAHRDFLTGALTRRSFCEEGKAALRQQAGDGSPAALLSFDLDHFKSINDRLGHLAGDEVLKGVVATCQATLRPGDSLGRIGGEEFAVLLPGTDSAQAEACAERLRAAIEAWRPAGCPRVTASFGLAMAIDVTDLDDWFAIADAALYRAKRSGRNRCIAAPLPICRAA